MIGALFLLLVMGVAGENYLACNITGTDIQNLTFVRYFANYGGGSVLARSVTYYCLYGELTELTRCRVCDPFENNDAYWSCVRASGFFICIVSSFMAVLCCSDGECFNRFFRAKAKKTLE